MASRPKRKFVSTRQQEDMLQAFYNDMGKEEELFLGHSFIAEEANNDSDYEDSSGSDQDDNVVQVNDNLEEMVENVGNDVENIEPMEPVELPRKQKFKNMEDVLDENNYVDLPLSKIVHSVTVMRKKQ